MDGSRRGFTLVEMAIVVAIIALLVGIAMPNFQRARQEATRQRAGSELRTLATAVESYYLHNNNTLPATLAALTTATPRLVSVVPTDPFRSGNNQYSYAKDANGLYYVVWSYGPDAVADVTGIDPDGTLASTGGNLDDDIFVTNGTGAL